jgi:hypothetical protein
MAIGDDFDVMHSVVACGAPAVRSLSAATTAKPPARVSLQLTSSN